MSDNAFDVKPGGILSGNGYIKNLGGEFIIKNDGTLSPGRMEGYGNLTIEADALTLQGGSKLRIRKGSHVNLLGKLVLDFSECTDKIAIELVDFPSYGSFDYKIFIISKEHGVYLNDEQTPLSKGKDISTHFEFGGNFAGLNVCIEDDGSICLNGEIAASVEVLESIRKPSIFASLLAFCKGKK